MTNIRGKLTRKSQRTIAKVSGTPPGDMLVCRVMTAGRVTLARAEALDRAYLKAMESTLSEWDSPEDAAAYDNLR